MWHLRVFCTLIFTDAFVTTARRRRRRPLPFLCSQSESSYTPSLLLEKVLSWFQGDFDNYNQVTEERQRWNMTSGEGGGHEHIHCTLLPLKAHHFDQLFHSHNATDTHRGVVLATYYLDGDPTQIFRMRLYSLSSDKEDNLHLDTVRMKLYLLHPQLQTTLRSCLSNITQWDHILYNYITLHDSSHHPPDTSWIYNSFRELLNCDILWMHQPDTTRHSYLFKNYTHSTYLDPSRAVHAYMMYDLDSQGVLVASQMHTGQYIRIQDELSLWENNLWINDRGYQANNSTHMVYGNRRGIPYQLERVFMTNN